VFWSFFHILHTLIAGNDGSNRIYICHQRKTTEFPKSEHFCRYSMRELSFFCLINDTKYKLFYLISRKTTSLAFEFGATYAEFLNWIAATPG
jgi:hypothetical protein